VLLVKTCNDVEAPAIPLNIWILYALRVVEPPLVLAADKVTVDPDSAAVNVNWSVPLVDICELLTHAPVPSVTVKTSYIDPGVPDSPELYPTTI
jgi:hypothetical protein